MKSKPVRPCFRVLAWCIGLWMGLGATASEAQTAEIDGFVVTSPIRQTLHQIQEEWETWKRGYFQADEGATASATKDLLRVTRELGLENLPDLSVAASIYAVRAAEARDTKRAAWVLEAAEALDAGRAETAFARAIVRRTQGDWIGAALAIGDGVIRSMRRAESRTILLHNLLLWLLMVAVASGALFVVVQMAAKGADLIHDVVRALAPPLPFAMALPLAVAAVLWPLLLPNGLLWVCALWALLLWGYGTVSERFVLLALLLLVGLAPALLRVQQRAVQLNLSPPARAMAAMARGDLYAGLFRDLQVLTSLLPDDPAVAEFESDLHRRLGQWEIAHIRYHEQLENEPANAIVANNLGVYFFRKQDFASAIIYFERATQADALLVEGFYNLNLAHSQNYEFAEARQALARAKELGGARVDAWLEAEGSNSRAIVANGSFARYQEIRSALRRKWGRESVPVLAALRGDLSVSVGLTVVLLAIAIHLLRRRHGYSFSFARDAHPRSTASRLRRALIPGYASALEGAGLAALGGVTLATAVITLPLFHQIGYRSPVGVDAGVSLPMVFGGVALLILVVLRVGNEFTAEGR